MKSYPTKYKSCLWKIVQMGALQKLQNSIQTLIIFWPVYPIHKNSLFWAIFVELPFAIFLLQILLFVVKTLKYSGSFI